MHFWWGAEAGSDAGPLRAQRQAAAGAGLLQAASGERHALLLLTNHTVHACGDNSRGQLGRRGVLHRERPEPVQALANLPIDLVNCGKEHFLAVCHRGKVFAWGAGSEGQLGTGKFEEICFTPQSLQEVLNDESSDIKELDIYFSIHWDQNDVDLVPSGTSVLVNEANKKDYVSKCVDYIFNISIKAVYEEFHKGFYRVFDQEIIKRFQPEELMTAVIGSTDYNWEDFEKYFLQGVIDSI